MANLNNTRTGSAIPLSRILRPDSAHGQQISPGMIAERTRRKCTFAECDAIIDTVSDWELLSGPLCHHHITANTPRRVRRSQTREMEESSPHKHFKKSRLRDPRDSGSEGEDTLQIERSRMSSKSARSSDNFNTPVRRQLRQSVTPSKRTSSISRTTRRTVAPTDQEAAVSFPPSLFELSPTTTENISHSPSSPVDTDKILSFHYNPQKEKTPAGDFIRAQNTASNSDEDSAGQQLVQELDNSNLRQHLLQPTDATNNSSITISAGATHLEMTDAEVLEIANATLDQHTPRMQTPMDEYITSDSDRENAITRRSSLAEQTSSHDMTDIEIDDDDDDQWLLRPHPNGLEAVQRGEIVQHHTADMDDWFYQTPRLSNLEEPSERELADTQEWGHIDPHKVWPEELSSKWIEDKRIEIKSRGGRKANFGKLITSQMLQEQEDNGWKIHQTREAQPLTAERRKINDKIDEMLGLRDLNGMVPLVRNHVLYMTDPDVKNGRGGGRGKSARAYRVG